MPVTTADGTVTGFGLASPKLMGERGGAGHAGNASGLLVIGDDVAALEDPGDLTLLTCAGSDSA